MQINDEFRDSLELDLATIIAPELARAGASKFYVVHAAEAGFEFHPQVMASTHLRASLLLREAIGPRWAGPGPGVIMNVRGNAWVTSQRIGKAEHVMNSSATHELVHNLLRQCLFAAEVNPDPDRLTFDRLMLAGDVGPVAAQYELATATQSHDWRFIRVLLHAAERLRGLKRVVPVQALLSWQLYTNRTGWHHEAALADEIESLAVLPLSAIAALPRPDTI